MIRHYLFKRVVAAVLFIVVVSSASVFLVRWAPGDFVTQTLGTTAAAGDAERMRSRLGLDRSPLRQYVTWASGALRFDFGSAYTDGRPVAALVYERALNTALLAATALLLATLLGIALGTVAGSRPRSMVAIVISRTSLALLSMPPLLTSLLLLVFAAATQWLPVSGMRSTGGASGIADVLWHMIVPVLALALPMAATFERIHARSVEDTLHAPYLLAAQARGIGGRRLLWVTALKPSLRAVVSLYGVAAAALFSGSFAVEAVTAWPGLGRLLVDALRLRDVYLVAGCAAAGASILAVATLSADILLTIVDPRSAE